MRLGFWNRLALVIGVVVTFVVPSWLVFSVGQQQRADMEAGYETCTEAASAPVDWYAMAECNETWGHTSLGAYGWKMWFEHVAVTAISVIVIYLIIVVLVQSGIWVWKGRNLPE
jgi:hypothetical protein